MTEVTVKPLVEFRDVSFSHAAASSAVISHLTFTVQQGETLVEVDALRSQRFQIGQTVGLRAEQYRLFPSGLVNSEAAARPQPSAD